MSYGWSRPNNRVAMPQNLSGSRMGWRGNKTFPVAHFAQGGAVPTLQGGPTQTIPGGGFGVDRFPGISGSPGAGTSGGLLTPAPPNPRGGPIFSPPGQPPGFGWRGQQGNQDNFEGVQIPHFAHGGVERIGGVGIPTFDPNYGVHGGGIEINPSSEYARQAPGGGTSFGDPFAGYNPLGGAPMPQAQSDPSAGGGRGGSGQARGGSGGGRGGVNPGVSDFTYVPGLSDIANHFDVYAPGFAGASTASPGVYGGVGSQNSPGYDPGPMGAGLEDGGVPPRVVWAKRGLAVPGKNMGVDSQPAMVEPGEVILNKGEQSKVKQTGKLPSAIATALYNARKKAK